MQSLGERGCIPAKNIRAGDDGEQAMWATFKCSRRLSWPAKSGLTDGQPVPAHEHVQLSREKPVGQFAN